ncbi:TPA: hypothetical protein QDA71_006081 [Burkholderia vietnamiensis]|uniref:hypothetical protein n=1 Tax=Burkholderia vietnamiensis TaxID=60552 RepID=UPI00075B5286|nr:hypothetical protein [Burkholderia vietnamiensis]KVF07831.1 hypothetical protein WJ04_12240 [Burkholderia vietnamiensis]KVF25239.1 hypothetical protein WJ08_03945 [Burkholderia vietnamiensis]KVF36426.1 hypothetical protein WJ10_27470 [Burkholderia vietnamiensis]KVF74580.1 hypothetical protein WJ18_24760 [Burkholderia vietnamiensis]KVF86643.1 hypothetical protein WJ19_12630 [Burkholderia vietnamiensis]
MTHSIPAAVVSILNRAANSAAIALRAECIPARRSDLRAHGAAVVNEQVELSGGRHPETPQALDFLHDILVGMMVEHATQ